MKYRTIMVLMALTVAVVAWGDNDIPQSIAKLKKWEKATKQKAAEGDADACRMLYMSNQDKYADYGQQAVKLYEKQGTAEAYYHLAEIYAFDTDRRDSLLQRSADMGYQPATEQIASLNREVAVDEIAAEGSAMPMTLSGSTRGVPKRYVALSFDRELTAADAPSFMEKARKYEKDYHRREAIWYYRLAYELDPVGCAEGKTNSDRLLAGMWNDRYRVEQQLQQEQIQREINSQRWQAVANSAAQLTNSLQQLQRRPARQHTHAIASNGGSSSSDDSSVSSGSSRSSSRSAKTSRSSRSTKSKSSSSESTLEESTLEECRHCGGQGTRRCALCLGKGGQRESGIDKNGKQVFTFVKCIPCRGSGRVTCHYCEGSGKY